MIIGFGTDIIDIRRIEQTLIKFGDKFKHKCFTEKEINRSETRLKPYNSYAKRFAAKEAFVKALGTGFTNKIYWRDIGVENDTYGKPFIKLSGNALSIFKKMSNKECLIELALSDEKNYAIANVIIFEQT